MTQKDKYAYRYTRFYTEDVPDMLKQIDYADKVVLDLGAGDGEIIYGLEKQNLLKGVKKVYAVEISPLRYKLMKKTLKPMLFDCKIYQADAMDMKRIIDDESIDIVICNQVIEHVEDDVKLIEEIHRILKPNGKVYLSTVYKTPINFCYHRNAKGERTLDPTHVREYTTDELIKALLPYYTILNCRRKLQWFSVTDFVLGRMKKTGFIYEEKKWLKALRKIKLPIIGCFNWEFYLQKHTHTNAVFQKPVNSK
jgi:ubiquinone/menaquinone biosynthesis C-methylase UbiE